MGWHVPSSLTPQKKIHHENLISRHAANKSLPYTKNSRLLGVLAQKLGAFYIIFSYGISYISCSPHTRPPSRIFGVMGDWLELETTIQS